MSNGHIENGLALAGALLVMVGVLFAAGSVLADETQGGRWPKAATAAAKTERLADAEQANRKAAADAIASIAEDNELDLEIRLHDRNYSLVARTR